ncbi:MAG: hypothetical protein HY900_08860, partial [Deltaproteobacteria bacterium]|nr:hypothetical protein [Deltaproteobacteria bacterium]
KQPSPVFFCLPPISCRLPKLTKGRFSPAPISYCYRSMNLRVIFQVMLLDIVFSLDSVITAVGMVDRIEIMAAAVVIAAGVMMVFAGAISRFVDRHPTIKMLALAFLLLIGFTLIVEGLHQHVPKGYIYFAMAFSVFVELLNLRLRKVTSPVKLHDPYAPQPATGSGAPSAGSSRQGERGGRAKR